MLPFQPCAELFAPGGPAAFNICCRGGGAVQCSADGAQRLEAVTAQQPPDKPVAVIPVDIGISFDIVSRGGLPGIHDRAQAALCPAAPEIRASELKARLNAAAGHLIVVLEQGIPLFEMGKGSLQQIALKRFFCGSLGSQAYQQAQDQDQKGTAAHVPSPVHLFHSTAHYTRFWPQ